MRLIDADKLLKDLEEFIENLPPFKGSKAYEEIIKSVFYAVIHFINRTPTVEMRPKGKWLGDEAEWSDEYDNYVHCSACGSYLFLCDDKPPKYCMKCGAEMDGYMCCSSIEDAERI